MIAFDNNGDLVQSLTRPRVYLDHWAVVKFARSSPLQQRFLAGLNNSGGTWMFSVENLNEFMTVTDQAQLEGVERLLTRALPSLALVDFRQNVTGTAFHPEGPRYSRTWMFEEVARRIRAQGGRHGLHGFVLDNSRSPLRQEMLDIRANIARRVMEMVSSGDSRKLAKKFRPLADIRPEETFMKELMRCVVIDQKSKFIANDASDLLHAATASLECDFVLLDKAWADRVDRVRKRFRDSGRTEYIARPFAEPSLDQFFVEIGKPLPQHDPNRASPLYGS